MHPGTERLKKQREQNKTRQLHVQHGTESANAMRGKTRNEIRATPSQRGEQPQQNPHETILPLRSTAPRILKHPLRVSSKLPAKGLETAIESSSRLPFVIRLIFASNGAINRAPARKRFFYAPFTRRGFRVAARADALSTPCLGRGAGLLR